MCSLTRQPSPFTLTKDVNEMQSVMIRLGPFLFTNLLVQSGLIQIGSSMSIAQPRFKKHPACPIGRTLSLRRQYLRPCSSAWRVEDSHVALYQRTCFEAEEPYHRGLHLLIRVASVPSSAPVTALMRCDKLPSAPQEETIQSSSRRCGRRCSKDGPLNCLLPWNHLLCLGQGHI